MSYTSITVNQAFPFISLLSEFGGFMGLLLGASCLTLCELFDYMAMWLVARAKKKSKVTGTADQSETKGHINPAADFRHINSPVAWK